MNKAAMTIRLKLIGIFVVMLVTPACDAASDITDGITSTPTHLTRVANLGTAKPTCSWEDDIVGKWKLDGRSNTLDFNKDGTVEYVSFDYDIRMNIEVRHYLWACLGDNRISFELLPWDTVTLSGNTLILEKTSGKHQRLELTRVE